MILIQCYGRNFDFSGPWSNFLPALATEKQSFDRFLQGIQDVEMITGHLYAGQLEVDIFEMKSLRVIRGQRELFNETDPDAKGFLIDWESE